MTRRRVPLLLPSPALRNTAFPLGVARGGLLLLGVGVGRRVLVDLHEAGLFAVALFGAFREFGAFPEIGGRGVGHGGVPPGSVGLFRTHLPYMDSPAAGKGH